MRLGCSQRRIAVPRSCYLEEALGYSSGECEAGRSLTTDRSEGMAPAERRASWRGWTAGWPSEGATMCSRHSEAPSGITAFNLSSSRTRCGTAPSVAIACSACAAVLMQKARTAGTTISA